MIPIRGWGPKGKRTDVCAARSLAHADIPRGLEEGSAGCTLCLRFTDQRPMLSRLCRASVGTGAQAGRHRHYGQSREPQISGNPSAINAAGARLWFLPPYSPDLNPIEQALSKIKHWMRNAQKRTVDETWQHIGRAGRNHPTLRMCHYPKNAGYGSVKRCNALTHI